MIRDIIWLAGLLEGEGCFSLNEKTPTITLCMTDKDIVEKVAKIFKRQMTVDLREKRSGGNKNAYITRICAADAVGWMLTLYSLLGIRRQSKIREILDEWKQIPLLRRQNYCSIHNIHLDSSNGYVTGRRTFTCALCAQNRGKERRKKVA